ncbi:MAG: DUF2782 domain-containing protein [Rhodocyclales bacterium]|nr:DUF2782 domain-containing protein [Rhodocyclales bacterium]
MRRLLSVLFLLAALPVAAQNRPADLKPLPDVPPPPPGVFDASLEPQVTIVKRGENKEEEFRVNGKLYMIKVTPPHGTPYFLLDPDGHGTWERKDPLDTGLRVPMWVIGNF